MKILSCHIQQLIYKRFGAGWRGTEKDMLILSLCCIIIHILVTSSDCILNI